MTNKNKPDQDLVEKAYRLTNDLNNSEEGHVQPCNGIYENGTRLIAQAMQEVRDEKKTWVVPPEANMNLPIHKSIYEELDKERALADELARSLMVFEGHSYAKKYPFLKEMRETLATYRKAREEKK